MLLLTLSLLASPLPSEVAPPSGRFWGILGHRVVARVAAERLSPAARTEVSKLLGGESMASVSGWADSIRNIRPSTDGWHYVNIPVLDSSYRAARVCRRGCIVTVIDSLVAVLRDKGRAKANRGEALRYLIHLVADLHQPLHAGDRGDRGGNDLQIRFLGRAMNLHALWDGRLLQASNESEESLVRRLVNAAAGRREIATLEKGSITDWAMESHDVARDQIYLRLPTNLTLTTADAARLRPIAEEQLLRGGVRLAAVLERALAP